MITTCLQTLYLAIFLWTSVGMATPCKNVRLDQQIHPMLHGVRDQDGLGLCYAYTAAQLLDAHRWSQGDQMRAKDRTSALALAMIHARDLRSPRSSQQTTATPNPTTGDPNIRFQSEGGWICPTIESARVNGFCTQEQIEDRYSGDDKGIQNVEDLWEKAYRAYLLYLQRAPIDGGRVGAKAFQCSMIQGGVREQNIPNVERILAHFREGKFDEVLRLTFTCRERKSVEIPKCQDHFNGAGLPKEFFQDYFNQTDPKPLAISYCSSMLSQGAGFDLGRVPIFDADGRSGCGNHASLIVGSRRNGRTGKCQFLIRNSWGRGCGYYHRDFECAGGQVWVDGETLSKSVYGAQYLSDRRVNQ